MATTPTPAPVAPARPAPAPPAPAPARRRATPRATPPIRVAYTRHATVGDDSDDRILNPAWDQFKTVMALVGGILFFLVFGTMMFVLGVTGAYRSHPSTRAEQTQIERTAPTPMPSAPVVAQPPRRELAPEERAEQYKEERRRQYGIR